jgi:prephenate dehydratase
MNSPSPSLLPTVSFLGPEGTFAHLAAQKRFGEAAKLVSAPSIADVFDSVSNRRTSLGLVPIENSSGGTIYETVDRLVEPKNRLIIQESLSINVRLALIGKSNSSVHTIYSHFAPLHHCEAWLKKHYPSAVLVDQPSTAQAAQMASKSESSAAIANRDSAKRYGLKVLAFPIEQDIKNVTQFFVLGHDHTLTGDNSRMSIVVTLPNRPGSLLDFLAPFKDEGVNLTRILSRPLVGRPEAYVFLVDLAGTQQQQNVVSAIKKAAQGADTIKNIGSYPVRKTYNS